jgi:hypothetical protein
MKITLLTSRVEQRGDQLISHVPGDTIEVSEAEAQRMINSGLGVDESGEMVAEVSAPAVAVAEEPVQPAPAVAVAEDDEPALTEDGPVVPNDQLAAAKAKKAKK